MTETNSSPNLTKPERTVNRILPPNGNGNSEFERLISTTDKQGYSAERQRKNEPIAVTFFNGDGYQGGQEPPAIYSGRNHYVHSSAGRSEAATNGNH